MGSPDRIEARRPSVPIGRLATLLLAFAANVSHAGPRSDRIDRVLRDNLADCPEGTVLTVWAGFSHGRELYVRDANRPMPVASAIKAAILLELYARYEGGIDQPPAAADGLLGDASHPALAHFSERRRGATRDALGDSTIDEIGRVMIGKTKASNPVYNGAANVAIGLLGGPEAVTRAFQKRDPAFHGLVLNRYMLADRTEQGDNMATAATLAAVHLRLATRKLPGLREATIDRVRAVLAKEERNLQLYSKGGSLSSDPLTRVRSGWREGDRRSLVCVVMGSAPKAGLSKRDSDQAYGRVKASVAAVWDAFDEAYESAL